MKKAISYTLIFLGIQLLVSGIITVALQFIDGGSLLKSPYVPIVSMLVFSVVSLMVFIRLGWAAPTRDYLLSRPWFVVFWSVLAALGSVIPSIAFQEQLPELPNFIEDEMSQIFSTRGGYFIVCLLVPLVEELVFRGAVLRALLASKPKLDGAAENRRHWIMIAISALLFSLAHLNPAQMIHAFFIGLLLGWMYYRTNSIVPGVVFHWVNNTVAFVMFNVMPELSDGKLIDLFHGNNRMMVYALMFSLCILLPSLFQLAMRTRK
jgi:membrane protease YdiL (CAAX protease family)